MIKYSSDNKNCVSPSFIASALNGLQYRLVQVMECEVRVDISKEENQDILIPPSHAIASEDGVKDPRIARFSELLPLSEHKNLLDMPEDWEMLFSFLYVLSPSTDEHGWEYRSVWSDGLPKEREESWVRFNSKGLDARRRIWVSCMIKSSEAAVARTKLSEAIDFKKRGVILIGDLFRYETYSFGLFGLWQKRFIALTDTTLEVFECAGGKRLAEYSLINARIRMLFGSQCPGRDFAFSVRDSKGDLIGLFDAEDRDLRRRWVIAIRYQLALYCEHFLFPPFEYGPPVGEEPYTKIYMCGELQKLGHVVKNWKMRYFQLTPTELQYFDKESMKGTYMLHGAVLSDVEKTGALDFSITDSTGLTLVMRAESLSHKDTWFRAIQRQILVVENRKSLADFDRVYGNRDSEAESTSETTTTTPPATDVNANRLSRTPTPISDPVPEVTEQIRQLTISVEGSRPDPRLINLWEDPDVPETLLNAQNRSSTLIRYKKADRSSIALKANMSPVVLITPNARPISRAVTVDPNLVLNSLLEK